MNLVYYKIKKTAAADDLATTDATFVCLLCKN